MLLLSGNRAYVKPFLMNFGNALGAVWKSLRTNDCVDCFVTAPKHYANKLNLRLLFRFVLFASDRIILFSRISNVSGTCG